MKELAIKVEGLGKKYTIGKIKDGSLAGTLSSIFKGTSAKGEDFWALRDVSFEVNKGDVIGIIGKNGAGKSTLLKILSQITKPTEGRVEIYGRVASLLEVGTGFHPELTARENIFLNGTILGMSRKEVADKFDEIVAFSGIEKFIDTPVKRYSSGMYVRLAFAVAAHLEPEILIVDEVLAVGDAEFQEKCIGKMKDVAGQGRTVLFVSHNIAAVKQLCNKGIVLEKGKVAFIGTQKEATSYYQKNSFQNEKVCWNGEKDISSDKISLNHFSVSSENNELTIDQPIQFIIKTSIKKKELSVGMSIFITNSEGVMITELYTDITNRDSEVTDYFTNITFPKEILSSGMYSARLLFAESRKEILLATGDLISFSLIDCNYQDDSNLYSSSLGIIKPNISVNVTKDETT